MSRPEPLGVTLTGDGVNVAIVSTAATSIIFCLFAPDGTERRIPLTERTGDVWHGHVPGVAAGDAYGLRAEGPWDPARGQRFNPAKLLIDPHATRLDRGLPPASQHVRPPRRQPQCPGRHRQRTVCPARCGGNQRRLARGGAARTPWAETILYEMHVRGFTMRHPDIPAAIRGTFAGLAHQAAIAHLRDLGITAVELLPTAAWGKNGIWPPWPAQYWGYNPVAMCAPDPRPGPRWLDRNQNGGRGAGGAGIETILDVVLNHTGEGDALGPTLSLRGLDNALYYRLRNNGAYVDDTGCGNTLAFDGHHGVRLAMDSLRAWVSLGGAHGFRFDLGTTLGRREDGFDPAAPLLTAISQDPVLRGVKLISEPWDIGWGGYQLGRFPGGLGRMERPVRRRCPPVLARRWRAGGAGDKARRLR